MTQRTALDPDTMVSAVQDPRRREQTQQVLAMMRQVTGVDPIVWGTSIIGFGRQSYSTADGKHHEWFAVGVAARKAALTLYGLTYYGSNADLLDRLGEHTTGKGCLYIKHLDRVDLDVLSELVARAWAANNQPTG